MITAEERLERIHADLDSVRTLLQRPACSDPAEMLEHLRSAVENLSVWTQAAILEQERPEAQDIEEIRDSLRQMQPLFDNARSLQAGLVDLIAGDEWVPYDNMGANHNRVSVAGETQLG
ncbi:hypothetical protein F183_A47880 [Bryobacterales bacterium F-183]|nr:hypothetical protein F183_A47880 [Bryobacterales bacterium F-183]